MNGLQSFLQHFIVAVDAPAFSSRPWRLFIALAVIVVGFFVLEIVFRRVARHIQESLEKKGRDPEIWQLSALLPAFRLAAAAWLLHLAESLVVISAQLSGTPAPRRLKLLPVIASDPSVIPWKALVKLTIVSRPVTLRASLRAASTQFVPVGPGN